MQTHLTTITCKFGGDPAISMVEEVICAKFRRTDRRTPRDCISSWNELKTDLRGNMDELNSAVTLREGLARLTKTFWYIFRLEEYTSHCKFCTNVLSQNYTTLLGFFAGPWLGFERYRY